MNIKPSLSSIICITLATVFGVLFIFNQAASRMHFLDDQAFSFALAKLTLRGEVPLIGLPSHLVGRHLGPFYQWVVAACFMLAGQNIFLATILLNCLKFLSLGFTLVLASLLFGQVKFYTRSLPILLCMLAGIGVSIYSVDWVNHFLIVPAALSLLSAYLVISRGQGNLPLFFFACSITLQTHLTSVPYVIGLISFVLPCSIYLKPEEKSSFSPLINLSLLVGTVVLWVPTAIWEMNYPSNLKALFLTHGAGSAPKAGVLEAADLLVAMLIKFSFGEWILRSSPSRALAFVSLVIAVLLVIRDYYKSSADKRAFYWMCLWVFCLYVLFLARFRLPLNDYYLYSLTPLALILFTAAFISAVALVQAGNVNVSGLFLILFFILGFFGGINQIRAALREPLSFASLAHSQEVAKIISADSHAATNLVLVRGSAAARANAYMVHFPNSHLHLMQYGSLFKELPSARIGTKPMAAYLMVCPRDPKKTLYLLNQREANRWYPGDEVSLTGCKSCSRCRLTRLNSKNRRPHRKVEKTK